MPLSSYVKRGTGVAVLIAAVIALAAVMVVVYKGEVVNLNAAGMMQHPLRTDFALYYRDSLVALRSPQHDPYDLPTFRQVTAELGIHRLKDDPVIPSLSLPPLIWLVMPLTLLPLGVAYWVWVVLLLLCLVATWALVAPGGSLTKAGHLVAAAIFIPVSFAIADGQAILLVTAAVALSWWLLRREHDVWAGIVLALLILKPQIAFMVPLALLVAGRRKAFLSFLGTGSVLGVVSLLTIPWNSLMAYAGHLTQASRDPNMWSVNATLTAASQGGPVVGVVEAVLAAAVVALALRRVNEQRVRDDFAVVGGLLVSLLATPYLHYPDLTILVLGGWVFLRTAPPAWQQWLLFAGYWLATMDPVGVPFFRTLEMVWLACLLRTPSPWLALQAAGAIFRQRLAAQASRAA